MQAPDESIFMKLRDARIAESRLKGELKTARMASESERVNELERELATREPRDSRDSGVPWTWACCRLKRA